jgi:exosortase C (VPDSG-CTERM-specific)
MHEPNETMPRNLPLEPARPPEKLLGLPPKFLLGVVVLLLGFSLPLYNLVRFALQSELYSYVLLIPFVSVYLFGLDRKTATPSPAFPSRVLAGGLIVAGLATLVLFWSVSAAGTTLVPQDSLAITTLSFVLLLAGVSALFLSKPVFRSAIFPLVFLVFMVPFPQGVEHAVETFLQRGSAPPAYWFLKMAGTPVFRADMVFQLPGMTLQIAPECSGIRSSIVLFITSLIAGHLFLRSPWKRTILCLAVIPLALVRNGFRIFVIGELCVHVGPHMIDTPIHHQGGAIFFALSLIPFSLLTYYLVKTDRTVARGKKHPVVSLT